MKQKPIFGFPCSEKDASLVFLPVPWDATTSYGKGTSNGPEAILDASGQIDTFDLEVGTPHAEGLHMREIEPEIVQKNHEARKAAESVMSRYEESQPIDTLDPDLQKVNRLSREMNEWVYENSRSILHSGKALGIVGGDHSVPFGAFQAVAETIPSFGILHFDAHFDLRNAYQGFEYSHASIMHNAVESIPNLETLVSVGIRDFCREELEYQKLNREKIRPYFDLGLQESKQNGTPWVLIAQEIVSQLPENVWVSFDIDGLDPKLCPNTGTPVPGGLDFAEATAVLKHLVLSGRKLIGLDLVEVSPSVQDSSNEWDANVGMRLLYKMAGWLLKNK